MKEDIEMSKYMLLLYANDDVDDAERARRWAELPAWDEVIKDLRESAMLISNDALHGAETATTVRVRGGDAEVTDGPFAITKEILAGYFLVECPNLDDALKYAARLPIAKYGSVEVRPILESLPDAAG
jgi:hypothetical protein